MSANLVVATVKNKALHLKLVIYNNNPRITVEDYSGGKPSSLLNVKVDSLFITKVLDLIEKITKENRQQADMVSFHFKDEQTQLVKISLTLSLTQTQNNLYILSVSGDKGSFDLPLMSHGYITKGNETMTDQDRSILELNNFKRELEQYHAIMANIKTAKYNDYIKENPPQNKFQGRGPGSGAKPQYNNYDRKY